MMPSTHKKKTLQAACLIMCISVGVSFNPVLQLAARSAESRHIVNIELSLPSSTLLAPPIRIGTVPRHRILWKLAKSDNDGSLEGDEKPLPSAEGEKATTSTTKTTNQKSFVTLINEAGQSFKPLAEKATSRGYQENKQPKKFFYGVQACVFYFLFIVYRAYRGFFVLLPAVFRQVYQKMEAAMNSDNLTLVGTGMDDTEGGAGTEKAATWRTKLTVSVLASVVTVSYVLGGIVKMTGRFIRTITKTSSVSKSFEAAADEIVNYEGRIERIGKINGEDKVDTSGLAP